MIGQVSNEIAAMATPEEQRKKSLRLKVLGVLLVVLSGFGARAYLEYTAFEKAKKLHSMAGTSLIHSDWEAAEKQLEAAIEAYKYMPAAWEELATTKEFMLKYDEAAAVLKESLVHLPKSQRLNLLYSIALVKIGDKAGAVAAAQRTQELDPGEAQSAQIIRAPDKLIAYYKEKIAEEKQRAKNPKKAKTKAHDHDHAHEH